MACLVCRRSPFGQIRNFHSVRFKKIRICVVCLETCARSHTTLFSKTPICVVCREACAQSTTTFLGKMRKNVACQAAATSPICHVFWKKVNSRGMSDETRLRHLPRYFQKRRFAWYVWPNPAASPATLFSKTRFCVVCLAESGCVTCHAIFKNVDLRGMSAKTSQIYHYVLSDNPSQVIRDNPLNKRNPAQIMSRISLVHLLFSGFSSFQAEWPGSRRRS